MSRVVDTDSAVTLASGSRWPGALLSLGVVLAALAVPFWDTAVSLVDLWNNNGSYGHGLLIVPVTLYLLWLRRDAFRRETPRTSWLGVLAVALLMLAWLFSRVLGILMGEQLVLHAMLFAVTLALLGWRVLGLAALPLLYLLCAIPIWSYLVPHLQVTTAIASTSIARAVGVPIYLEGLYMTIPDGRFVVAEICSGMRYLLASLSLGGFYALLNLQSWWTRLALVIVGFALGIVFNYVRVAGIVVVGHVTDMQSPLVQSHVTYGWFMFLLVVLLVLVVGRLLERVDGRPLPLPRPPHGTDSAGRRYAAPALVLMLLLAPSGLARAWLWIPDSAIELDLAGLGRGEWKPVDAPVGSWHPMYRGHDAHVQASYSRGGPPVDLFVAYFATQRQGSEAVNDAHRAFDGAGWRWISQRARPKRVSLAPGVPGEEFVIQPRDGGGERRVVWRTARINDSYVVDRMEAKRQQVLALLSGRPAAASLAASTPIVDDESVARARLRAFFEQQLPALETALAAAGAPAAAGATGEPPTGR